MNTQKEVTSTHVYATVDLVVVCTCSGQILNAKQLSEALPYNLQPFTCDKAGGHKSETHKAKTIEQQVL